MDIDSRFQGSEVLGSGFKGFWPLAAGSWLLGSRCSMLDLLMLNVEPLNQVTKKARIYDEI